MHPDHAAPSFPLIACMRMHMNKFHFRIANKCQRAGPDPSLYALHMRAHMHTNTESLIDPRLDLEL